MAEQRIQMGVLIIKLELSVQFFCGSIHKGLMQNNNNNNNNVLVILLAPFFFFQIFLNLL
jgi:hypothetical protein